MISALDLLKFRLSRGGYGPNEAMGLRGSDPGPQTYGEGQVIPGPRNPLMEQEAAAGAFRGPQRENELLYDRSQALGLLNPHIPEDREPRSWALPEGDVWSSRPPGASPFAGPLNQMMQLGRRAPLSLY